MTSDGEDERPDPPRAPAGRPPILPAAAGVLAARVADRRESAQALVAESTQLRTATRRLWAESARLRTRAAVLRDGRPRGDGS